MWSKGIVPPAIAAAGGAKWTCSATSPATRIRLFSTSNPVQSVIGRRPLKYPHEVSITLEPFTPTPSFPRYVTQALVTGPRGSLSMPIAPFVEIDIQKPDPKLPKRTLAVAVKDPKDRKQRAMWGTTRALLDNMVEGVVEGYTVPIRFQGVGYRATLEEGKLSLKLGYSHPIVMDVPQGVELKIPAPTRIILQGNDWHQIKQFAASIRKWRPPEPYNQKGIFVGEETIKKREGKKK
ncbi:ribosomal protein L6, alpha-beta domain-containing protein [Phlyctochytrium arcticum]|nr:ribosomal protein L6, alpha-beta domain-containing protein [Phlyctochytrium arcticum]